MTVPRPFQDQGRRRALAPLIRQSLPIRTTRLVEPFSGSATKKEIEAMILGANQK
jgi:hypothetical protein